MRLLHEAGMGASSLMNKAGCLGQAYYTAVASEDAKVTLQTSGAFGGASMKYYVSLSKKGPWELIKTHSSVKLEIVDVQQSFIKAVVDGGSGTYASGEFTFGGQPSADQTVTISDTIFTFKASAADVDEVTIGADQDETLTNLYNAAVALRATGEALQDVFFAINTTTNKLTVTAVEMGVAGNSIALTETASNVTVTGSGTLTGGVDDATSLNADISP